MILTGNQIDEFRIALLSAYPNFDLLKQMLRIRLNKRLEDLVGTGALNKVAFNLLEIAESEGWLPELLLAARQHNSGNPLLMAFEQSISMATLSYDRNSLEAKIRPLDKFLEFDSWINKLQAIEKQVCRIEIANDIYGTGFLLAPDVVLTNYHVVEHVIKQEYQASDIVLRFDYKKIGSHINEGELHPLAENWLIDYSTYGPLEFGKTPILPTEDELDYALLRLAVPLDQRGFVKIPVISSDFNLNFQINAPLFIVQHPDRMPLKLALDTQAIIGLNANETRLHYRTITEGGSSGSPCFNLNWELIALHHSGQAGIKNGGIPITKLVAKWKKEGLDFLVS